MAAVRSYSSNVTNSPHCDDRVLAWGLDVWNDIKDSTMPQIMRRMRIRGVLLRFSISIIRRGQGIPSVLASPQSRRRIRQRLDRRILSLAISRH